MKQKNEKTGDLRTVALSLIVVTSNPRKEFGNLDSLKESIKQDGQIVPMIVRPLPETHPKFRKDVSVYELLGGERRLRALTELKMDTAKVEVIQADDKRASIIRIVDNIQRENNTPLEECDYFEKLIKENLMTVNSIAFEIGQSEKYVAERLILSNLIPELRKAFSDRFIQYGQSVYLAKCPPNVQKTYWKDQLGSGKTNSLQTVDALRDWIRKNSQHSINAAPFDIKDASLDEKAGSCLSCPKLAKKTDTLFPELKSDTCTDPECFVRKINLNAAAKLKSVQETTEKAVEKISTRNYYSRMAGLLTSDKYTITDEKDPKGRPAVIFESDEMEKIGRHVFIKDPVREQSSRKKPETRISDKKDELRVDAERESRRRFARSLIDGFNEKMLSNKKFRLEFLRRVATKLDHAFSYENTLQVVRHWVPDAKLGDNHFGTITSKIKKMNESQLWKMISVLCIPSELSPSNLNDASQKEFDEYARFIKQDAALKQFRKEESSRTAAKFKEYSSKILKPKSKKKSESKK